MFIMMYVLFMKSLKSTFAQFAEIFDCDVTNTTPCRFWYCENYIREYIISVCFNEVEYASFEEASVQIYLATKNPTKIR
jgi:hypothetical protein